MQFVSDGKTKQVAIPRDWLIPPQDEKDDESYYVTSFHYDKGVSSFPIGNGRMGLHFSSYEIQAEGSAQGAAGRDVFLIFDPKTSAVSRGGIERGITKERIRSQGCFEASMEHYFLADVDGDGLTDIGVVKEELLCLPKQDADGEQLSDLSTKSIRLSGMSSKRMLGSWSQTFQENSQSTIWSCR